LTIVPKWEADLWLAQSPKLAAGWPELRSVSNRRKIGSTIGSKTIHDFLQRIEQARASLRAGLGSRLEDLE
jgi:hypothetical protein